MVDPAEALPDDQQGTPGRGAGPPLGPAPSIGVPAIPAPPDRSRAPLTVPSVDVPDEPGPVAPSPLQLAPLPTDHPAEVAPPEPGPEPPGRRPAVSRPAVTARVGDELTGFGEEVSAKLKTYVYLLVDARTGRPIYAGRGRGDRCFRHLDAARTATPATDDGESFAVLDRIRQVESSGRRVRIDILRHGLSGQEADTLAAAVNDALGLPVATGPTGMRRPAVEVNAVLAKRAKIKRSHQVVLLRVGGTGSDTTYESARHHWRIGKRWIDPGSPRSPRYALLVAGDLVSAVHRIDGWVPSGARGSTTSSDRYSFSGPVDPELETRYVGRNVAAYLGQGAPGPVTYVWCGPHWVNTPR